MGVLGHGVAVAIGFVAGVAYREKGGTIDWQQGEKMLREQVNMMPARFDTAVKMAKQYNAAVDTTARDVAQQSKVGGKENSK